MKKLILLILLGVQSIVVCVAQYGVNFEHLTFAEALEKARIDKKLVFVDCYTVWCGPCKYMADKVFPTKEAGDFFNSRFVCLKMDMEQGEGKELVDKWQVKVYPSFFLIRPDGKIQHSLVGGFDLKDFIQKMSVGLNPKTSLLYFNEQYEKGKITKKEMLIYAELLSEAYQNEKAKKVYRELRASLTDKEKMQAEYWKVFSNGPCEVGTPDFDFLQAHLSAFKKNVGEEKLNTFSYEAYGKALFPYLCGRAKLDPVFLKGIREQIAGLEIPKKDILMLKGELAQATFERNIGQIVALAGKFSPTLPKMELMTILAPLVLVRDVASKSELAQIVELGEELLRGIENKDTKSDVGRLVENFKNLAHVGVYFEDLTFEQALKKAEDQGKMVFIDCYTSWCGPCKYMAEKVFPQEKVGDFMNSRFICVKYDMEKGEGPGLAKKLEISAYPTFVLLKADGTIWHKTTGGGEEADQFIERIGEGLDTMKATGVLETKYKAGCRDKELLMQYLKYQINQHSPKVEEVARELWQVMSDEDKVSRSCYFMYTSRQLGAMGAETEQYLLAHRDQFYATVGKEEIDNRLSFDFRQQLRRIFAGVSHKITVKDLDLMKKSVKAMNLSNEKSLLANIEIARSLLLDRSEQLLTVCEQHVADMPVKDFFYIQLIDRQQEKMTPSQKIRWITIGEGLLSRSDNDNYSAGVQEAIKVLKNSDK